MTLPTLSTRAASPAFDMRSRSQATASTYAGENDRRVMPPDPCAPIRDKDLRSSSKRSNFTIGFTGERLRTRYLTTIFRGSFEKRSHPVGVTETVSLKPIPNSR